MTEEAGEEGKFRERRISNRWEEGFYKEDFEIGPSDCSLDIRHPK